MNDLEELATQWNLERVLVDKLHGNGYQTFFSVQKQVIPVLIRQNSSYLIEPRDLCVSAPTGSGKTLAYALPIVDNLLKKQSVKRLRALILLPSRELAVQVYQVFQFLTENTALKVALATSSTNIQDEKLTLVGHADRVSSSFWQYPEFTEPTIPEFGVSVCDILVATPGRLLDHLQFTKGFTLEHLRFLILDEADRLLGNAYHNWVRQLLASATHREEDQNHQSKEKEDTVDKRPNKKPRSNNLKDDGTLVSQAVSEVSTAENSTSSLSAPTYRRYFHQPLQRLLFSATLTDNPAALSLLGMKNPLHVHCKELYNHQTDINKESSATNLKSTDEEDLFEEEIFELPDTLIERTLLVEMKSRLLKLFGLLLLTFHSFGEEVSQSWKVKEGNVTDYIRLCQDSGAVVMIFVNSVDSSHRLTKFLQVLNNQLSLDEMTTPQLLQLQALRNQLSQLYGFSSNVDHLFIGKVAEMTRLIKAKEREEIIQQALTGEVSIIVCSDRMARGIDLPNLKLVINYDLPKFANTYIHRAGRTSRAGRKGMCLSLVKKEQLKNLNTIRESIGRTRESISATVNDSQMSLKPCYMSKSYLDSLTPLYDASIQLLPQLLSSE